MPRQPRLDAPGVLHHAMVRGMERRVIFRDDADRADFVARLATSVTGAGLTVPMSRRPGVGWPRPLHPRL